MSKLGTRIGADKVEDIVTALLARAKRRFPNLSTHGTVASQDGMIVYRITHELAIQGEEPWIAIIKLTQLWKSDGRSVMALEEMKSVVEEYDCVIDQADAFGLIKSDDFSVAE